MSIRDRVRRVTEIGEGSSNGTPGKYKTERSTFEEMGQLGALLHCPKSVYKLLSEFAPGKGTDG